MKLLLRDNFGMELCGELFVIWGKSSGRFIHISKVNKQSFMSCYKSYTVIRMNNKEVYADKYRCKIC
jgi:hypothetical protein